MDFGVLYIDLFVELQLEVICGLFGFRGAGESQTSRLKIKLERFGGNIRHRNGQVDVVLLGIGGG